MPVATCSTDISRMTDPFRPPRAQFSGDPRVLQRQVGVWLTTLHHFRKVTKVIAKSRPAIPPSHTANLNRYLIVAVPFMNTTNFLQTLPGAHCFYCHKDYADTHEFDAC